MVVGRSGSGKSSLVYAGLLPALRRERDRFWNVLALRPGPTPLRALAAAFNPCDADNEGATEYSQKITNEANKLRTEDPDLLSHMIREELERSRTGCCSMSTSGRNSTRKRPPATTRRAPLAVSRSAPIARLPKELATQVLKDIRRARR
jgi:hypothetical protein